MNIIRKFRMQRRKDAKGRGKRGKLGVRDEELVYLRYPSSCLNLCVSASWREILERNILGVAA